MKPLTAKEKQANQLIAKEIVKALDLVNDHCHKVAKDFNINNVPLSILELTIKTVKNSLLEGMGVKQGDVSK